MSEGEPFRYCVFCDADCDALKPAHAEDCPATTGLWPVLEQDLRPGGMRCMDCRGEFVLGDVYVLRNVETGVVTTRPDIGEVVCVGCGANAHALIGEDGQV